MKKVEWVCDRCGVVVTGANGVCISGEIVGEFEGKLKIDVQLELGVMRSGRECKDPALCWPCCVEIMNQHVSRNRK